MIKGIIFDMDGVIIDSNGVHYERWNTLFQKKFKITLNKEEFASHLGESSKHFSEHFLKYTDSDATYDSLFPDLKDSYQRLKKKIVLKKGVITTLRALKKDYKIALATGANKKTAIETLTRFDILKYFDFIVGGDEVKNAKPAPEIFLKAADGLGIRNKDCVVVEDSYNGLIAAKKAGMHCIIIKDEFTKHQDHSKADRILESMEKLKKTIIGELDHI